MLQRHSFSFGLSGSIHRAQTKAMTMSDGNQGPGWWFTFMGHQNTNRGMAVFLGVLLAVIVVFGLVMWMLLP